MEIHRKNVTAKKWRIEIFNSEGKADCIHSGMPTLRPVFERASEIELRCGVMTEKPFSLLDLQNSMQTNDIIYFSIYIKNRDIVQVHFNNAANGAALM